LGGILAIWLLAIAGAASAPWRLGIASVAGPVVWVLLLILFAGAASQFAVSLVNWFCTLLAPPRPTMRLDFSAGIPAENRTLVAVPSMLSNAGGVRGLMEQLEHRYLANRDDNLLFMLLTDFPDAPRETMPDDRRLLILARREIERLNRRYRRAGQGPFYLLHRPRKWNEPQGVWMGEERKRGKLAALNEWLQTGSSKAFILTVGDLSRLASVHYVITLDSDTRLSPHVGRELVGCMAHPLNWPEIDPVTHTVVEGYALLQPRVGATIPEASRSLFSRLLAGDAGNRGVVRRNESCPSGVPRLTRKHDGMRGSQSLVEQAGIPVTSILELSPQCLQGTAAMCRSFGGSHGHASPNCSTALLVARGSVRHQR